MKPWAIRRYGEGGHDYGDLILLDAEDRDDAWRKYCELREFEDIPLPPVENIMYSIVEVEYDPEHAAYDLREVM